MLVRLFGNIFFSSSAAAFWHCMRFQIIFTFSSCAAFPYVPKNIHLDLSFWTQQQAACGLTCWDWSAEDDAWWLQYSSFRISRYRFLSFVPERNLYQDIGSSQERMTMNLMACYLAWFGFIVGRSTLKQKGCNPIGHASLYMLPW